MELFGTQQVTSKCIVHTKKMTRSNTYCMQPFLISYIFPEIHGKLYAIFAVFREDLLRYS